MLERPVHPVAGERGDRGAGGVARKPQAAKQLWKLPLCLISLALLSIVYVSKLTKFIAQNNDHELSSIDRIDTPHVLISDQASSRTTPSSIAWKAELKAQKDLREEREKLEAITKKNEIMGTKRKQAELAKRKQEEKALEQGLAMKHAAQLARKNARNQKRPTDPPATPPPISVTPAPTILVEQPKLVDPDAMAPGEARDLTFRVMMEK